MKGKTKYTKIILETAVLDVTTFSDLIRVLTNNNKVHGSMIAYIKEKLVENEIDFSHFTGKNPNKAKSSNELSKEEFIDNYLSINANRKTCNSNIKKWINKFNIIEYKCISCNNKGEWLNKPINLQLDHINGINSDNRIENLRFLCPNCHSQTDTYAGKNSNKKIED